MTAAFGLQAGIGAQADQKLAPNCMMFVGNSSFAPFGSVTIAEANLKSGEFKDQSITYKATGSEAPGDGTYGAAGDIIIGFWLAPNSPAQSYLDFDNVRLKATPGTRPLAPPTPVPNYFGTHL